MTPDAPADFDRVWADSELDRFARHLAGEDVEARVLEGAVASLPTLVLDGGGRPVVVSILSDAAELDELTLVQLYADLDLPAGPSVVEFAAGVNVLVAIGALVVDPESGVGFRHVNAFRAEPMLDMDALMQLVQLFVHQVNRIAPALARVAAGEVEPAAALAELDV